MIRRIDEEYVDYTTGTKLTDMGDYLDVLNGSKGVMGLSSNIQKLSNLYYDLQYEDENSVALVNLVLDADNTLKNLIKMTAKYNKEIENLLRTYRR